MLTLMQTVVSRTPSKGVKTKGGMSRNEKP